MEATQDVNAGPASAQDPDENPSISVRWEQRIGAMQWYLVVFGVIVTAPIVAIVLKRLRSGTI